MRVLFVSKPIAPPFHDGTKCLVRDIARCLQEVDPVVLSSRGAPPLADGRRAIEMVPIYGSSGSYAPALAQNIRAAAWLLTRSQADVWHFIFAPNTRTSQVGRLLRKARGVPVVQTIASPPRQFENVDSLLFGDTIVAQSRWTRQQILDVYSRKGLVAPPVHVIPPPVPMALTRSAERVARFRAELGVAPGVPLFVYPGDMEVSSGARVTAELSRRLTRVLPDAVTVFAYRAKTPRAKVVAAELKSQVDPARVRFVSGIPDVLELVAGATAIVFPVDDLWGKVDLPIVLLEAMVLGVPVVALGRGPLLDLEGTELVPSLDPDLWVRALVDLAQSARARRSRSDAQREAVKRHSAANVAAAYEALYLSLGNRASVA